jgi:hypothetical protein
MKHLIEPSGRCSHPVERGHHQESFAFVAPVCPQVILIVLFHILITGDRNDTVQAGMPSYPPSESFVRMDLSIRLRGIPTGNINLLSRGSPSIDLEAG